jgi:polysaccharide export outer membrane protein
MRRPDAIRKMIETSDGATPRLPPLRDPARPRDGARRWRRLGAWALAAAIAAGGLSVAGCATDGAFIWVQDIPLPEPRPGEMLIGPRDTILVEVRNQAALSGEFLVGDGGDYRQPNLGPIHVAGKTPQAVAAELEGQLKQIIVTPQVTVSIVKTGTVRVSVVGEVKTPGAYELSRGRGVLPALAAAGWLNEFARRDRIFVLRGASPQTRIRFRIRELTSAEPHAANFVLQDGDVVVVE